MSTTVVATALGGVLAIRDGACCVVRHADTTHVLAVGAPEEGEAFALSGDARRLAHVERDGMLSVWDVAAGTRLWRKEPGPSPSAERFSWLVGSSRLLSTGAPRFVGERLVTLHAGAILVHDAASGTSIAGVADPGMAL